MRKRIKFILGGIFMLLAAFKFLILRMKGSTKSKTPQELEQYVHKLSYIR